MVPYFVCISSNAASRYSFLTPRIAGGIDWSPPAATKASMTFWQAGMM